MQESVYQLDTIYGLFNMWISNDIKIDPITRKQSVKGKTLAIGAKNKCVYIKIPNNGDSAHLHNVKTSDGGCEINDILIKGEKTIGMVNLAFNIIKKSKPHIKYITLDDRSNFPCHIGDNKYIGVSLDAYNLLFHQKTWYEKNFGAYLQDKELNDTYMAKKENFYKPKPDDFSFNNEEAEMYLNFVYNTTPDWKTFFDSIYKQEDKCRLILPWYKSAISKIMGSNKFLEEAWIIDLYKIPKDNTDPYIPDIEFTGRKISGGSRFNTTFKKGYNYNKKINNKYMSLKDKLSNIKYTKKEIQGLIDIINKLNGTDIKYVPSKKFTYINNKNINKELKNKDKDKNIYYDDSLYASYYEELYTMKFSKKLLNSLID